MSRKHLKMTSNATIKVQVSFQLFTVRKHLKMTSNATIKVQVSFQLFTVRTLAVESYNKIKNAYTNSVKYQ